MEISQKTAVALICHGSRDPKWRHVFEQLTVSLQTQYPDHILQLCYMEIATPTLQEVVMSWTRMWPKQTGAWAFRVRVLPLFMASGGHVDHDIPAQIEEVTALFPDLDIAMARPIGEHPLMVKAIGDMVTQLCV